MLVGPRGVVLLRDEIREQGVGQRLVTVGVDARHVDGDPVVVPDILRERLARHPVEDDDAHHSGEADEEVVLSALVVMEAAQDALARVREIHLPDRLRQHARASELREPATVVGVPLEREAAQSLDHPVRLPRTKSFTR